MFLITVHLLFVAQQHCLSACSAHLVLNGPSLARVTGGRASQSDTPIQCVCNTVRHDELRARTGVSGDAERLPTIGSLALIEQCTRNASFLAHSSAAHNMEGARARRANHLYLESDRVYVTNTRDVSCVEQRWGAHRGFRALQFSKHIDNASISPGICIDGPQSPRSGVCVALRRCFDQSLTCAHTLRTTSTLAQK